MVDDPRIGETDISDLTYFFFFFSSSSSSFLFFFERTRSRLAYPEYTWRILLSAVNRSS